MMITSTSSGTRVFATRAATGSCARACVTPAPTTSNIAITIDMSLFTVISSLEPRHLQRLDRQRVNFQRRRRERVFGVASGAHEHWQSVLLNRQQQLLERLPFVLGNHDFRKRVRDRRRLL